MSIAPLANDLAALLDIANSNDGRSSFFRGAPLLYLSGIPQPKSITAGVITLQHEFNHVITFARLIPCQLALWTEIMLQRQLLNTMSHRVHKGTLCLPIRTGIELDHTYFVSTGELIATRSGIRYELKEWGYDLLFEGAAIYDAYDDLDARMCRYLLSGLYKSENRLDNSLYIAGFELVRDMAEWIITQGIRRERATTAIWDLVNAEAILKNLRFSIILPGKLRFMTGAGFWRKDTITVNPHITRPCLLSRIWELRDSYTLKKMLWLSNYLLRMWISETSRMSRELWKRGGPHREDDVAHHLGAMGGILSNWARLTYYLRQGGRGETIRRRMSTLTWPWLGIPILSDDGTLSTNPPRNPDTEKIARHWVLHLFLRRIRQWLAGGHVSLNCPLYENLVSSEKDLSKINSILGKVCPAVLRVRHDTPPVPSREYCLMSTFEENIIAIRRRKSCTFWMIVNAFLLKASRLEREVVSRQSADKSC